MSAPCNICGKNELSPDANGRLAKSGSPPRCVHCGSVELHRSVHAILAAVPRELLDGSTCLCLTRDPASDAAGFGKLVEQPVSSAGASLPDFPTGGCGWAYSSWPVPGGSEPAVLEELLRVVGSGFVVLVEDAESAKNPRSQGASFSDGLRGMFPNLPLLELVALDPCTLTLSCAAIISRDERRLVELAKAVTRHNIHTRVFGVSRSALGADQAGSAASVGSVVAAAASGGKPQLSPLAATRAGFPPEFDEDVYRSLHRDLAKFSGTALREHYMRHGESEGRRSHVLKDREAFAALLSPELDVLEIGPLFSPLLRGPRVRYFELFDTPNLRSRAVAKGHPPELVPDIHYVSPTADLSIVDAKFDAVISSHVIEHQPDLLAHLDIVRGLLRPGGLYFALIPDKEHCFDHFMAPSTIADLLDAHVDKRTRHTLRSQVAYAALRTHNDSARHWRGDHGPVVASAANVARAVDEYVKVGARYEDVHAWYFTPTSFRGLLELSRQLGETEFSVLRLYPALTDSNEFWAILQAGA